MKARHAHHAQPNSNTIQWDAFGWVYGYGSGKWGRGLGKGKGEPANEIKLVFPNAISAQQMYRQRYNARITTRPNYEPNLQQFGITQYTNIP